jgi:hypothetical protein
MGFRTSGRQTGMLNDLASASLTVNLQEVARSMEGVSFCGHNHKLSFKGVTTTL